MSGPSYVTIIGTVLTFNPPAASVGTNPITLCLNDGTNTPQFTFNLNVVANSKAIFNMGPLPPISTPAGTPTSYFLPGTLDPEN